MKSGECGRGWRRGAGGKCVRSNKKRTARQVLGGMLGGLGVAAIGGAAVARFKHLQKQKESARFQSLNDRITQGIADDDRIWEEYRKKEKDALSDGYSADPWAPLSSKAKTSDTDRVAFESLKATDPSLDPWQSSARKKKSKPRKKSTKKKRSDSLPKLRDRLDARNKQCGKGWEPAANGGCDRSKKKSLVSAIRKGGWGGKYTSPGKRALLAGGAIAGVVGLAALKKHRSKQKASEEKSVPLPKLRERLDARNKVNGQCGKGWTEGPGDKCIRPKGKFDIHYGQKKPGLDIKHGVKKLLFGSGDVEYNRQRSAGASQWQAFNAGSAAGAKGMAQDFVMGGGSFLLPGGKVGGAVYRRSRDAGQGRARAGLKGLAAGLSINVPLAIAATKGLEKLREYASQQASQQGGGQATGQQEYSEKFAKAKRRTPITQESLQKSRKKQQRKNHPDLVSKLQEPAEWDRRNRKAQKVEHSFNKTSKKLGIKLDSLTRARLRSLLTKERR